MSAACCARRRSRSARQAREGRDHRRRAQGGRGSRDRGADQEAGSRRAASRSPTANSAAPPGRPISSRRSTASSPTKASARSSSTARRRSPIQLRVNKKLGGYTPHPMIEHYKFVQSHTKATPKMTIPSPSTLHFRFGRKVVPESIYPSMDDYYRDLGQTWSKTVTRLRRRRLPLPPARRDQSHLSLRSRAARRRSRRAATIRTSCRSSMPA